MVTMTRELERGLIEAGVSPEQAEQVALTLEERFAEVATKGDIADVKESIAVLRHDIERQIDKLERTMWRVFIGLGTIMLAMFGATFGALMYAVFG